MAARILTVRIASELDVVAARQRARQIAALCGFGAQDQVRIATSVSELARNVFNYAGSGSVEFAIEGQTVPQLLEMRIMDQGPGIPHLDVILGGNYHSETGMGVGITGARRLMDCFDIAAEAGRGTTIVMRKFLPAEAPLLTAARIGALGGQLAALPTGVTLAEVQQQNQELLSTLAELKSRQEELIDLTRELEDTNRGVVALYAELDEKADHLRRADQMKSRFLSNMSHEFRTPLNSIRALARLLLDRVDGELTEGQEKQVGFILNGALGLSELVNDLLDLAKIEAGKVEIQPARFRVAEMFSALRGMLRPLLVSESLNLVFIEPEPDCVMYTDEAKLSQILRNFISNALKFTPGGSITVSAEVDHETGTVRFAVADTGIGIAPDHLSLIFEEFSQVESVLQGRVKGTGLGLPLCRNLAALLKGKVGVASQVGRGSTFTVELPISFPDPSAEAAAGPRDPGFAADTRPAVLFVEDHAPTLHLYQKYLEGSAWRVVAARNLYEADAGWAAAQPVAVVLDIVLGSEEAWRWLAQFKGDPARNHVPVIVITEIEDQRKGLALGADAYYVKPVFQQELLQALHTSIEASPRSRAASAVAV